MFNSEPHQPTVLKVAVSATFIAALACSPLALAQEHEHGKQDLTAAAEKSVTGEVVDLMCYIDHGATGDKHSACGSKCIKGGGPVGIVENGKAYLVVGEHKPINDELAESCGKTVTIKGKVAERGGMVMLENAEVVKK
ncbi:MAG TPA: hypothetical protein VIV62_02505 [Chthoniobacterales bacterium]|jgi:hypothetical protein